VLAAAVRFHGLEKLLERLAIGRELEKFLLIAMRFCPTIFWLCRVNLYTPVSTSTNGTLQCSRGPIPQMTNVLPRSTSPRLVPPADVYQVPRSDHRASLQRQPLAGDHCRFSFPVRTSSPPVCCVPVGITTRAGSPARRRTAPCHILSFSGREPRTLHFSLSWTPI
jgi:hypothetical protein